MRIRLFHFIFLIGFFLMNNHIFCQQNVDNGNESGNQASFSDNNKIPDQDDAYFFTPTVVVTPIYSLTPQEKKVWALLSSTKSYIDRINLDTKRYEKFLRENLDKNLMDLGKVISTIHTAASIYERDKVEYVWSETIKDPVRNLQIVKEYVNEFNEDFKTMGKNQKKVKRIIKKESKGIQKIDEVKKAYNDNNEDIKEIHKKIIYFENLYNNYEILYAKKVKEKEAKINKLITDNKELHKP